MEAIIPHSAAPATIQAALDRNWSLILKAFGLAPTVVVHDDPRLFWYVTGLPDAAFNSIKYAALEAEEVAGVVATLHALRERYGVPMDWLVGPSSRPADLGAHLQANGLRHLTDLPLMTLAIHRRAKFPLPAGLTIERVTDPATFELWAETEMRAFESEGPTGEGLRAIRRGMGVHHGWPLYHLLGRLDGVPVATGTVLLEAGIAGIYDVATAPQARRRGIGAAMTNALLALAESAGYEMAWLLPSPEGRPVYARIGFEVSCHCPIYG